MSTESRGRPFLALAVATGLGTGYAPVAPGTFGSAVGVLLWLVLPAAPLVQLATIVVAFAAGVWAAGEAERHYGGTDPSAVVIDEIMGMLVALFMVPVAWPGALGAFLLFRVFDVIKPFPVDRLEYLHGGLGVMADDAMAGVYANLALRLLLLTGLFG